MRAHIIKAGVVVNTIEVESLNFLPGLIDASSSGRIGDLWDGHTFTTPAPVVAIPQSVTRRQAKQTLRLAGKLPDVQSAIDAMPDAMERGLMQDYWDDSQEFDRTHPSLISMATAIGLSSADVDQLFITASTQ